jgi:transposase-like protein
MAGLQGYHHLASMHVPNSGEGNEENFLPRLGEDITEALRGTPSGLNKKIYWTIEAWRNRPIEGGHPYVCLDGVVHKSSSAGEVRNVSLLVAVGVNSEGYREILGICEGAKEEKAG